MHRSSWRETVGATARAPRRMQGQYEATAASLEPAPELRLSDRPLQAEAETSGSPEWGMPRGGAGNPPYVFLQPIERTAG